MAAPVRRAVSFGAVGFGGGAGFGTLLVAGPGVGAGCLKGGVEARVMGRVEVRNLGFWRGCSADAGKEQGGGEQGGVGILLAAVGEEGQAGRGQVMVLGQAYDKAQPVVLQPLEPGMAHRFTVPKDQRNLVSTQHGQARFEHSDALGGIEIAVAVIGQLPVQRHVPYWLRPTVTSRMLTCHCPKSHFVRSRHRHTLPVLCQIS